MAEGASPNKRPKTDGRIFASLEDELPDELLTSFSVCMPTNNGFGLTTSQSSSNTPQQMTGTASVMSPNPVPISSLPPNMPAHKKLTQYLQQGHNSPKHTRTSPSRNNSPRSLPTHPHSSPLSAHQNSMQSPSAGSMAVVMNNMKSPPSSLSSPNSRPSSALVVPNQMRNSISLSPMNQQAVSSQGVGSGGMSVAPPLYSANFYDSISMSNPNNTIHPDSANVLDGLSGLTNGLGPNQVGGLGHLGRVNQGLDVGGNLFHSPRVEREWHKDVKKEMRNHLVQKLVHALYPSPTIVYLIEERMKKLVTFARRVEGDMYEQAKSLNEYYHMLATKIYKIQKELEEKRASRMNGKSGPRMPFADDPVGMNHQVRPMQRDPTTGLMTGAGLPGVGNMNEFNQPMANMAPSTRQVAQIGESSVSAVASQGVGPGGMSVAPPLYLTNFNDSISMLNPNNSIHPNSTNVPDGLSGLTNKLGPDQVDGLGHLRYYGNRKWKKSAKSRPIPKKMSKKRKRKGSVALMTFHWSLD